MRELTAKQRRFVDEYLIDLNATRAALRAGYSRRSAGQQASRLLRQPRIAEAVRDGQDRLAKRARLSAREVLGRLAELRDAAAAKGQYAVALRAEELRGRHIGMFAGEKQVRIPRLEDMTEEEILATLGLDKNPAPSVVPKPRTRSPGRTGKGKKRL